jgi:hypothetical protein
VMLTLSYMREPGGGSGRSRNARQRIASSEVEAVVGIGIRILQHPDFLDAVTDS